MDLLNKQFDLLSAEMKDARREIRELHDKLDREEGKQAMLESRVVELETEKRELNARCGKLEDRLKPGGGGSPEDMIQIVASLLEPLSKACAERLSHETDQTRCASKISKNDLRDVRDAFKAILQVKDAENDAFERENCEESWNKRYEVDEAAEYLRTIKTWATTGQDLEFIDVRGHVLRSSASPLNFPISGSNDVVLILRQYRRDQESGCFLGMEMKRGLTAGGLRQAEIEFYLWARCTPFPFVQIISDMQTGGAAIYNRGSRPTGHNIVLQFFNSMDSVRDFVKGVVSSIPDNVGQEGPNGVIIMPPSMSNPERKRWRVELPEPVGQSSADRHQADRDRVQRGLELIAAMQPDVGNELLCDLDAFDIPQGAGMSSNTSSGSLSC